MKHKQAMVIVTRNIEIKQDKKSSYINAEVRTLEDRLGVKSYKHKGRRAKTLDQVYNDADINFKSMMRNGSDSEELAVFFFDTTDKKAILAETRELLKDAGLIKLT